MVDAIPAQPDAPISEAPAPAFPRSALYALGGAYFIIGSASLGAVGMIQEMRGALGVSASAIAGLVTVSALIYAVAAPMAQTLLGHLARRRLIAIGLGAVAGGCALSAAAASYEMIVGARVLMAMGAAVVGPTLAAAAATLVAPKDRARALSTVFGGMTLSAVLGIPLASFLAQELGWRWAWGALALGALASAAVVMRLLPGGNRGDRASLRALLSVLTDAPPALLIAATGAMICANFACYALIAVWLVEVAHAPLDMIPATLLFFGLGGVAGNAVSPFVVRRLGAGRAIAVYVTVALAAVLLLPQTTDAMPALLAVNFLWAACGMAVNPPIQARLVELTGGKAPLALALNSSSVYLGMSVGAVVAALIYETAGPEFLPYGSAAVIVVALGLFTLSGRASRGRLG